MVITTTTIGGGGACRVEGVDDVSGRKWSAIHREAGVHAQHMTWLFTYFDVSWVVHGVPRSQVPCSGRDATEVRRARATCTLPSNRLLCISNMSAPRDFIEQILEQISYRAF